MDQVKLVKYLGTWVFLAIGLLIASKIFPNSIVLGNASLTSAMAGIINSLILVLLLSGMPSVVEKMELRIKDERFSWTIFFFGNLILIWILKRLATITGIGIASIYFVILLALFVTVLEMVADKYGSNLLKGKK